MRTTRRSLVAAASLPFLPRPAMAQDAWPSRPVRLVGPAFAHRADAALDADRRRPAHGVGERDLLDRRAGFSRDRHRVADGLHDLRRRHVARIVAAEGGLDADAGDGQAGFLVGPRHRPLRLDLAGAVAVEVLLLERLRRREGDRPMELQPVLEGQRPVQPVGVEPECGEGDARRRRNGGDHILRIRPARHQLGRDEGADLDLLQPSGGQRFDQCDLALGRDRAGFDLEALARAFLADLDGCGQVGHAGISRRAGCPQP